MPRMKLSCRGKQTGDARRSSQSDALRSVAGNQLSELPISLITRELFLSSRWNGFSKYFPGLNPVNLLSTRMV